MSVNIDVHNIDRDTWRRLKTVFQVEKPRDKDSDTRWVKINTGSGWITIFRPRS